MATEKQIASWNNRKGMKLSEEHKKKLKCKFLRIKDYG